MRLKNAKQFQQRRSWLVRLRQPLAPSPPLLLSRVFAAPVLLPSRPGGSWREDRVRLKEDNIFFTSDRAVHWESKLVLCTGAFQVAAKLSQCYPKVVLKFCPDCPKCCPKVVYVIPTWCQVVSMRNIIWSQDELSECVRSC